MLPRRQHQLLLFPFIAAVVTLVSPTQLPSAKNHSRSAPHFSVQVVPPRNSSTTAVLAVKSRSFAIDHSPECNCFRKDGRPFRYIAGNMHYFQVPHGYWRDRMLKMRAAGLNVLQTYVAWNMHEPFEGAYDFEEQNNVFEYLELAKNLSLDVMLRIGPYINAERDFGGLPFWLLNINPRMQPRTSDPTYQAAVKRWWDVLLPRLLPHLYINGGNVLMVQIENEYGFHSVCDKPHIVWLYNLAVSHLGRKVTYYTTDPAVIERLHCGKIDGAFTTADFMAYGTRNTTEPLRTLRKIQPTGPLVNSEFYPGWTVRWNQNYWKTASKLFVGRLREILEYENSTSVTIYPFHGGTNFGFSAGGALMRNKSEHYSAFITSYDFNSPITENGDITPKYRAIKKVVEEFLPKEVDIPEIPRNITRKSFGKVKLHKAGNLFANIDKLTTISAISSEVEPPTFEQVLLNYGYALYEHVITERDLEGRHGDGVQLSSATTGRLHGAGVHDHATVFLDGKRISTICRLCSEYDVDFNYPGDLRVGQKLSLLVENQGRQAFLEIVDPKGINIGAPLSLSFDGGVPRELLNWTMVPIPINGTLWEKSTNTEKASNTATTLRENFIPTRYEGTFKTPADDELGHPADTFLQLNSQMIAMYNMQLGWQKGVALVNGRNLGRYWLEHSSQQTLYVPGVWLRSAPALNYLTIFETDYSPCECVGAHACKCEVQLVSKPMLEMPITKMIVSSRFKPKSLSITKKSKKKSQ